MLCMCAACFISWQTEANTDCGSGHAFAICFYCLSAIDGCLGFLYCRSVTMSRCCLLLVACSAASAMRQFVSCSASDISNHTAREQSRNPEREREIESVDASLKWASHSGENTHSCLFLEWSFFVFILHGNKRSNWCVYKVYLFINLIKINHIKTNNYFKHTI